MSVVLPFILKKRGVMKAESRNKETKPRSIHLPIWLWEKLDEDARRCMRSSTKQLEGLLTLCYDPTANIEIDQETLTEAFHTVSQQRKKVA